MLELDKNACKISVGKHLLKATTRKTLDMGK